MDRKQLYSVFSALAVAAILLGGCMFQADPAEQMYDKLEKAVEKEKPFEEQQEPLVKLEQQEQELYAKIIELDMEQHDEIVKLSDEAIGIVDKRKEHIDKEKESIDSSKEEFEGIDEIIGRFEEEGVKEQAAALKKLMESRYETYGELYESYTEGLKNDKQLYELLKDENVTMESLEEQVNLVNETYDKVLDANDRFNDITEEYNKEKLAFYKAAGLEVESE